MSSDYSYDEQGQFYPFFIFTLSFIITVPLTYNVLRRNTDAAALAPRVRTEFRPEHGDLILEQRAAAKRQSRKTKRIITVILGWALMAGMLYLILTTARIENKLWNPYEILGIPEDADEKKIRSLWKRITLKFHPDKIKPDPAKNETVESLTSHYVELNKAYQALTDEEVRNNWIQYGNPDGKQGFSIGIALPQFIVTNGNGKYVVLVYAMLLGVLLPYTVGSWWYGTQRMSKEGVLLESANSLFREYDDNIDMGGIITALSTGKEFESQFKGDKAESGLAKTESAIASLLSAKDKQRLENVDSGVRRKVLALLWAYLGRVELKDPVLESAKYTVAPIALSLTQSFRAISLAYGNTAPILASYHTSQRLVQALLPKDSTLLQLPHFTAAIVKAIDGDSKVPITLQEFMDLPDAKRRKLAVGKGLLSEKEYQTAVNVARQLPYFRTEKAFFKVTGEKVIIPSSLVSFVVKGRIIPPGSTGVPAVTESDLEDIDPAEDDLEAARAAERAESVLPPLTFAPRFARHHSPKWHIFLTDSKQGKMAVPPFTFAAFDKPIVDAQGKPSFNVQTLKAQFAAPPQPGRYTFVMHAVCDGYVGFDTKMEVTLVVEDASKVAEMDDEDEISEPDEDSLAGQMNAMRGKSAPSGGKARKRKDDDDSSSDDESGTEEEEVETSDTNTDTEDET